MNQPDCANMFANCKQRFLIENQTDALMCDYANKCF